MLIIQKLENEELTTNEHIVASYLLEHQNHLKKISITDIANNTYTSPSTTVRLAQKLGFQGWKELKEHLLDEISYLNSGFNEVNANMPFQEMDSIQTISKNIKQLLIDSIQDTYNLLDHDSLVKATMMIHQADIINIYGILNAVSAAYDFKAKMRSIGKTVNIYDNPEEYPYTIKYTNKHMSSLFVSYTGETYELFDHVKSLNSRKLPVLLMTSIGENTLSKMVDCTLYLSTREKMYSKIGCYSSNESIHFLFDTLYSAVFSKNYKKNLSLKIGLSKDVEYKRSPTVSIIKEDEN